MSRRLCWLLSVSVLAGCQGLQPDEGDDESSVAGETESIPQAATEDEDHSVAPAPANVPPKTPNGRNAVKPGGTGPGPQAAPAPGRAPHIMKPAGTVDVNNVGNALTYSGGPIMTATVKIYYIFYGTWSSTQRTILSDFAKNLGGTDYQRVLKTYYDKDGFRA